MSRWLPALSGLLLACGSSTSATDAGVPAADSGLLSSPADAAPDQAPVVDLLAADAPADGVLPDAEAAAARLQPELYLFDSTPVATLAPPVIVRGKGFLLTNTGAVPLGPPSARITGPDTADFQISVDRCAGQVLAPQASCQITVRFWPKTLGNRAAQLEVDFGGQPGPVAALSGLAVEPAALTVLPATHNFGSIPVGQRRSVTFEVMNTGGSETAELMVVVTGGSDEFARTGLGCDGPLAPGARCTVTVTFSPRTAGPKAASLRVAAAIGGSIQVVLTGSGL